MIQCVTVSDMLVRAVILSTGVCSAFEVFYDDPLIYIFTFYFLAILTTCVIGMVCLLCCMPWVLFVV